MISIKNMSEQDIEFYNLTRNLVKDSLHDDSFFTLEESKSWFLNTRPEFYIIFNNQTKIGYFRTSNLSIKNKNIYIGADLHPNFHGKGYAYESYRIFIPFIFNKYKLNKITLEVLSTNERAFNLYKKLRFKLEGIKRQEIHRENKYIDSIIMSLLNDEYIKP